MPGSGPMHASPQSEPVVWGRIRRLIGTADARGGGGPALAVGQVWQTQENWLVIGRIDAFEEGTVVSVSAYRDARLDGLIAAHLPFSEPTFRKSAHRLVARNRAAADGFEDGYDVWRAAHDRGEAGVW